jgi:hypothetical protein
MARLAPELAALPDQHRLIWTDARVRRDAIAAILTASERNSPELQRHVARVDEAVSAALDAMGLPRGPVAGVEIHEVIALWSGRNLPDCRLLLNGSALRHMLHREGNSDDVLRTWVHESLHARQPFHPGAASDALLHEGYEEGLVEGLARYVVRDMAGLRPLERSYGFYVVAYEALAGLLGTQPVAL